MRDRIFSRKFLGITLVPYTSRARVVSKTLYMDGYFAATCGKDKVVISSDDVFKSSFERHDYVQRRVAQILLTLEMITKDAYNSFIAEMKARQTDAARKKMKQKADELEYLLTDFGLELTSEQQAKINSCLNIEAA